MKTLYSLLLATTLLLAPAGVVGNEPDPGQICISVGRLLEQGHYSRRKLDDTMSGEVLNRFLEELDFNHLFFTEQDVTEFRAKYGTSLDDDILLGNPNPAFEIYKVYNKRVEDRVAKIKVILEKGEFDFTSDRTVQPNRQKVPWPKDEAEADKLWRDRVEGEFLQEKLNTHQIEPPVKVLTRRYDQLLRNLHEQTEEDIVKSFLSALAQTYDPHSEYMSKSELENFTINMKLSLVGIGAVLNSDDGYAKIVELVPGGPAQVDGRLKENDRITAVAEGKAEFVDVFGMKLDKVVAKIRGKKGTLVRLQVIPADADDPAQRKVVEIVRDEVKLKEQEAKAEIIEKETSKGVQRIGWITLPSFYADMERAGASDAKSTTRDVLRFLNRLKKEGITGLVVDLRRNGGGSLEEAVNLTGLFVKKGPVVQSKDANGNIHVSRDRDSSIAYDGPMLVLTNRLSASASEIFAAALQDYGRAIVVGDQSSFGKGTVQTMLEIGRFIPFLGSDSNQAGALKLTIQKFYRIAGGSTQLHGVTSDIQLPSAFDHPEIGESALKGPLPYDTVPPVGYEFYGDRSADIKELRLRSAARVEADPEFAYVRQDLKRLTDKLAANSISLNEKKRRAELASDKARKEKRTAERAARKLPQPKVYSLTLDNVDKPELQLAKNEENKETKPAADSEEDEDDDLNGKKKPEFDAVRAETLNIITDIVQLSKTPKTAKK